MSVTVFSKREESNLFMTPCGVCDEVLLCGCAAGFDETTMDYLCAACVADTLTAVQALEAAEPATGVRAPTEVEALDMITRGHG